MKLKSLILSFAFTLLAVSGLLAQEKYEYGVVKADGRKIVFVAADNEEVVAAKSEHPQKDLLKKVNELNEKGWEVYNTSHIFINPTWEIITYSIRKKKN